MTGGRTKFTVWTQTFSFMDPAVQAVQVGPVPNSSLSPACDGTVELTTKTRHSTPPPNCATGSSLIDPTFSRPHHQSPTTLFAWHVKKHYEHTHSLGRCFSTAWGNLPTYWSQIDRDNWDIAWLVCRWLVDKEHQRHHLPPAVLSSLISLIDDAASLQLPGLVTHPSG